MNDSRNAERLKLNKLLEERQKVEESGQLWDRYAESRIAWASKCAP
jgi:hypothetical protein